MDDAQTQSEATARMRDIAEEQREQAQGMRGTMARDAARRARQSAEEARGVARGERQREARERGAAAARAAEGGGARPVAPGDEATARRDVAAQLRDDDAAQREADFRGRMRRAHDANVAERRRRR